MRLGALCVVLFLSSVSSASELLVPNDYPTIRSALMVAVDGDEVVIAAGTYVENTLLLPSNIILRGATGDPSDVILDGSNTASIIHGLSGSYGSTISGITFQNGYSNAGGALRLHSVERLRIEHCVFRNNRVTTQGGAIHALSTVNPDWRDALEIHDCHFYGNISDGDGGALYLKLVTRITECRFDYNQVANDGGAILVYWDRCKIENSRLESNKSIGNGGAISLERGSSCRLIETKIIDNMSGENGGGVYASAYSSFSALNCDFTTNNCVKSGGAGYRGGVDGCRLVENQAGLDGGGLYQTGYMSNSVFTGNTSGRYGGGAHCQDVFRIIGCSFSDNAASKGGGAYIDSWYSDLPMESTSFTNNYASIFGGGLSCYDDLVLIDCIVTDNSAPRGPSGWVWNLVLACTDSDPDSWEANSITIDNSECEVANENMSISNLKLIYR